ncbi:hypothetical protein [Nisaea sp.]|uniref:hypothetical protein n=1 Tax=Nisaea sp. TaxID=2024842 RepID=UPI00326748BB
MITALGNYSENVLTRLFATSSAEEPSARTAADSNQSPGINGVIQDVIEISPEAQSLLEAEQAKDTALEERLSYLEQFRPTREGFSARNLALGIADPSAQPFSQERPFEEVATAARENLDAKYAAMKESGEPYNRNGNEGTDNHSLFGDLDRRALFAVASNDGGQFTEDEQSTARDIMRGQQGMAMGLYNGPSRLIGQYTEGLGADPEQTSKAGINYLDQVSLEEKATDIEWAHQRAAVQNNYENQVEARGGIAENTTSGHPLVALIRSAFDWGMVQRGNIEDADDLRRQEWFAPFADRLDQTIAETRELYGVEV